MIEILTEHLLYAEHHNAFCTDLLSDKGYTNETLNRPFLIAWNSSISTLYLITTLSMIIKLTQTNQGEGPARWLPPPINNPHTEVTVPHTFFPFSKFIKHLQIWYNHVYRISKTKMES